MENAPVLKTGHHKGAKASSAEREGAAKQPAPAATAAGLRAAEWQAAATMVALRAVDRPEAGKQAEYSIGVQTPAASKARCQSWVRVPPGWLPVRAWARVWRRFAAQSCRVPQSCQYAKQEPERKP